MSTTQSTPWMYSNRYSADKSCEHCDGVIRHETWCISRSQLIRYAHHAVLDASQLSAGDHIILHALGVRWADNACAGACTPCRAEGA